MSVLTSWICLGPLLLQNCWSNPWYVGSSRKLSQLPPAGELAGVENLGGREGGTGKKLGFDKITETSGDPEGVNGLPAGMSEPGVLRLAGMGEDGADCGRVTMTDGWERGDGVERLGKSLNWLIVGRFRQGREKPGES